MCSGVLTATSACSVLSLDSQRGLNSLSACPTCARVWHIRVPQCLKETTERSFSSGMFRLNIQETWGKADFPPGNASGTVFCRFILCSARHYKYLLEGAGLNTSQSKEYQDEQGTSPQEPLGDVSQGRAGEKIVTCSWCRYTALKIFNVFRWIREISAPVLQSESQSRCG